MRKRRPKRKLYRIRTTLTLDFVVEGNNKKKAMLLARENFADALQSAPPARLHAQEVTAVKDLPRGWRDAWPYGTVEGLTCAEVLTGEVNDDDR